MKFEVSKDVRGSSAKDESVVHTMIRRNLCQKRGDKLDHKIAVKAEALVKKGPTAKKESVPIGTTIAPESESDASEVRDFVADDTRPRDFVELLPELASQENPLRLLKIDKTEFKMFCEIKRDLQARFAKDNPNIRKKEFDTCMECWLERMYGDKGD